jgi:hypothetical protein
MYKYLRTSKVRKTTVHSHNIPTYVHIQKRAFAWESRDVTFPGEIRTYLSPLTTTIMNLTASIRHLKANMDGAETAFTDAQDPVRCMMMII